MKKFILSVIALLCLALAGCITKPNVPGIAFESWVHDGHYAPFTTHVEVHGVSKDEKGRLHVDSYTGSLTVLGGYGPSDTFKGLVIDPKDQAPAPVVEAAK